MGSNVIDVTPPQPQTPPQEAILVQETEVDIVAVPVPVPVMITPDVSTMATPDVSSDRVRGLYLALYAHHVIALLPFRRLHVAIVRRHQWDSFNFNPLRFPLPGKCCKHSLCCFCVSLRCFTP